MKNEEKIKFLTVEDVDIYGMELHDQFYIRDGAMKYSILKVHGGWVYSFDYRGYESVNTVFVASK